MIKKILCIDILRYYASYYVALSYYKCIRNSRIIIFLGGVYLPAKQIIPFIHTLHFFPCKFYLEVVK